MVLGFLADDNFDFTRKIVKKNLGEKLVKMLGVYLPFFLFFYNFVVSFFFQGYRNFCTNVILISSLLLWSANFAQEQQESCTVTNSDSFLIVNIVESLGSQTSQETQPKELPLSGK